jgi:hypothetical protein
MVDESGGGARSRERGGSVLSAPSPRPRGRVAVLLVWQLCALAGQVLAVCLARRGHFTVAEVISDAGLIAAYGSALFMLTVLNLSRALRNTAVIALGVTPTLMWRANNPLLFIGFDEQLHMRTLRDILLSHGLFQPNALLEVSPRYPGLEVVTTLLHQLGVPTMAAATMVVLACRVILVTVLCDAAEQLTGNARAGGIAVAVYAISPQFVAFNSAFAYQTMAIPLALAAVSLIARARRSAAPLPLLAGVTVCLIAVAVTHHVTSFLTATFLLVWVLVERKPGRIWVAYGACAAIASTLVWAIVQRQLLTDYFGPIARDVGSQFRGGERRELFKDSAGTAARSADSYLLIYYAAALCLIVATLLLLAYRWWRSGEHHLRWGPHLLMVLMAGSIPVLLAARVVPKGGELFDRLSSFLFFPLSILVAAYATRLWWRDDHPHFTTAEHRRVERVRAVTLVLAAAAFLGGYVLGSGPNWARLPGPYMVAADPRSMDAEVLAATAWADRNLPAGSRIAADRVGSALLSSRSGLWPVMQGPDDVDAPALYAAKNWGPGQTDMAAAMQLRYLYVDRRLADEMPHFGSYFYDGETGAGQQLTARQLAKFDKVSGLNQVYRHGPVSIYDLKALGISSVKTGWFKPTPQVRLTTQLAVGLLTGLLLAAVMRSRIAPRIRDSWSRSRRAWGPALTGAITLAAACLGSVLMLLAGVWLTPLTILSAGAVVVLTNFRAIAGPVRGMVARVPRTAVRTAGLAAVPLALIIAVAVGDAAAENVVKVRQILEDPAAIHVSATGARG